ncbi:phage tail length tape measure family protein [Pararhizobium sp. O133]|uniref:phage tail length tape measure family protein n=1 Tax=Pararhizobium sp. O133 TaxID=3449278 RepID=UPI003F688DC3
MAEKSDDLIISISTDMATVRRALKRLGDDIASTSGKVEKQFDKMGKGIDNSMTTALQTRIDKMVGIGTKGAQEWTGALADQGKELERLRARYNPLFATINNYKSAVSDIRRAHALGAISATEMTAAITKERQAALASTAAIKGRNAALKDTPTSARARGFGAEKFNTANLAAQFQDIGVTAAMGMSPLQIALQQGTQISAVLGPMGAAGAVKSLGAAFMSIVSPVSLATIGIIAGGVAAAQYFAGTSKETSKAEEALKNHSDLIRRIKEAWPEATASLKNYASESKKILQQDVKDSIDLYKQSVADSARDAKSPLLSIPASDYQGATKTIGDVQSAIAALDASIAKGNPDLRAFIERLIEIENQSGTPENIKKLIKEIREAAKSGIDAQSKLDPLIKTIEGIGSAAATQAKHIEAFTKAVDQLSNISPTRLSDMEQAAKAYGEALRAAKTEADVTLADDQFNAAKRRISNQNPTVINSDGKLTVPGVPGQKPVQLGDEPDKASQKAETAAEKAKNAYRDLLKSADDRINQLRLETELTGEYGAATDAARFRLDLLQQSEDKGRSLSPEQKAAIEEKVAAYGKYSEALAQAKLQQDLLDASAMRGLSDQDRQVKQALRQYGLPEDLGGKNAGDIRRQLQLDEITSASDAFIDNLTGALLSGGEDIGKKLGQVVLNALLDSAQTQISGILKQVFGALMSGGSTGAPVGAVASAASSFAAPVGAVTRSALPAAGDIGTYAKAIQAIESGGNYGALGPVTRNGDRAYGAYQVMGNNIGPWSKEALGRSMTASEFLADKGAQDSIFAHKFGGYAEKYGPSGAAQAWFGGPGSVGRGGMGQDILGTSGNTYVKMFETNVTKMGNVAGEATKGLGGLNNGLAAITQNFGAGAGLGGGGLGGFASLFSSSFKPNTTLSAFLGVGANAKGTDRWSGGPTWVGEDGPEIINAPKGAKIIPNHAIRKVHAPVAPRLNGRAPAASNQNSPSSMVVQIQGASGDPHVRELVRQGVAAALAEKNDNDRRGGVGLMQQRYAAQKG